MTTKAYLGNGTTLQYSSDDVTYTDVAETYDITGPNMTRDVIDVTNDDSPNNSEEIILAIKRGGEVTFGIIYKAAVASVQAVRDALQNGTLYYWKVVEADGSGEYANFQAYVTSFNITARSASDAVRATLTLRITGDVTFAS